MALIDDIVGILIVIIVVLVLAGILAFSLTQKHTEKAATVDDVLRQDTIAVRADAALHVHDATTKQTTATLLRDYLDGNYLRGAKPAVEQAFDDALQQTLGNANYYARITPKISFVRISFVIDGSDSLADEREALVNRIQQVASATSAALAVSADVYVYILTRNPGEECELFADTAATCVGISPDMLYAEQPVVEPPTFGYVSFQEYQEIDPHAPSFYYAEGDWLAGISFAEQTYREHMLDTGLDHASGKHILIPVTDELSTSSISDNCFLIQNSQPRPLADFIPCAMCEDSCPWERSLQQQPRVIQYLAEANSIAIPVYSQECGFVYNLGWNTIPTTPYNSPYLSGVTDNPEDTMCNQAACGGCDSSQGLNSVCFNSEKSDCAERLEQQLLELSRATGGRLVLLSNADALANQVVAAVQEVLEEFTIEIGVLDDSRERIVIERSLLLSTQERYPLRIIAYLEEYDDSNPPVFVQLNTSPSIAPQGATYTVRARITDVGGVQTVVANIQGVNVTMSRVSQQLYTTSAVADIQGTHTITVYATDRAGLQSQATTQITVAEPDVLAPSISALLATTRVLEQDVTNTITITATDDWGVQQVLATVNEPNGVTRTLELSNLEDTYTATFPVISPGEYTVDVVVSDASQNSATQTLLFAKEIPKMRILIVPQGFTSPNEVTAFVDSYTNYFRSKLPISQCPDPLSRFAFTVIPTTVCPSQNCYDANLGVQCHTQCIASAKQCRTQYVQQSGDTNDYDLYVSITKNPAECDSINGDGVGVKGIAEGIGLAWSSSELPADENFGSILLAHEMGHSMALCHVGPVRIVDGQQSPAGVDEPYCVNKNTPPENKCLMNYELGLPADEKEYCGPSTQWLEQLFEPYLVGCNT